MKRTLFRSLCLLLVTVTLLTGSLAGCSDIDTGAAVRYKDSEISRALFLYLCCTEKTNYLYDAYGLDPSSVSSSQLQDNSAIWTATDSTGTTAAATLKMTVLQNVQIQLYMMQYALDQGYTLTNEQIDSIKNEFNSLLTAYETKRNFNKNMKQYGVDYDQLIEYNCIQTLAYKGNELLFGEEGSMRVTDENARNYFNKNYVTVGAIFVNTKNKTYPNGKVVVLPAAEKAEKEQLANDLMSRLQKGEDFDTLCKEYCDMTDDDDVAGGYTFLQNGFVNQEAEKKAFEMTEGEIARVDVDGGVYILQRRALNADYYQNAKEAIRSNLESIRKLALIADNMSSYVLDEDYINELDVISIPHLV